MNNSESTALEQVESFVYTPYGVATVAAVSVLVTVLLWMVSCCIFFKCRQRRRARQSGVTEANREIQYVGTSFEYDGTSGAGRMQMQSSVDRGEGGERGGGGGGGGHQATGTMSSGYSTGPHTSHSMNSFQTDNVFLSSSLDSILEHGSR